MSRASGLLYYGPRWYIDFLTSELTGLRAYDAHKSTYDAGAENRNTISPSLQC
jgi:hypothetical protein